MHFILQTADDEVLALNAQPTETLVAAAQRQGVTLPVDCLEGVCGACKLRLLDGQVTPGFCSDDALSEAEIAAGWILGCQARIKTDTVAATPAVAAQLRARAPAAALWSVVTGLETVAADTVVMRLRLENGADLHFLPGQYAKLNVPGTEHWRAYSFSNAPGAAELEFLIRILPHGAMSGWLGHAGIGDRLQLRGPFGVFYARPGSACVTMIAGGTGLGPMLSMLRTSASAASAPSVTVLYGVNRAAEIACLEQLRALVDQRPGSAVHVSVAHASEAAAPLKPGLVTGMLDLIPAQAMGSGLFYLCGPPPMIEAARTQLAALGVSEERMISERFVTST
jgi:ferredoxin-NADP reductase/ferredoxin